MASNTSRLAVSGGNVTGDIKVAVSSTTPIVMEFGSITFGAGAALKIEGSTADGSEIVVAACKFELGEVKSDFAAIVLDAQIGQSGIVASANVFNGSLGNGVKFSGLSSTGSLGGASVAFQGNAFKFEIAENTTVEGASFTGESDGASIGFSGNSMELSGPPSALANTYGFVYKRTASTPTSRRKFRGAAGYNSVIELTGNTYTNVAFPFAVVELEGMDILVAGNLVAADAGVTVPAP